MEVSPVSNRSYHVELSPAESQLLNDLAYATDRPPEKILASLVFQTLAVEHSNLELSNRLEAFEDGQLDKPKPYNPANRD